MGNSNKTKRYIIEIVESEQYPTESINLFYENGEELDFLDKMKVERLLYRATQPTAWVYVVACKMDEKWLYKIGATKHDDPTIRYAQLRSKLKSVFPVHQIPCRQTNVFNVEKHLQDWFWVCHVKDEFFDLDRIKEYPATRFLNRLKSYVDVYNIRKVFESYRDEMGIGK